MAVALIALAAIEAWGGFQRVRTEPVGALQRSFAKELEVSCRRLEIPLDARVLVLTSLFVPMPISFPLAPRPVTLGVHYPSDWLELGAAAPPGSAQQEVLLAAAEFRERGVWIEPEGLAARLEESDLVLTIGLDAELMAALLEQEGVEELEQGDFGARVIWFEVRR